MRFRRKADTVAVRAGSGVDIDAFARAVDPRLLDEVQFVRLVEVLDMLGRVGTGIELAGMRTETFAWFVSRASTGQLDRLMADPHLRQVVFDEVFTRMSQHLDPVRAATLHAVVHWRFVDAAGEDRFETRIDGGACTTGREPTADPRVTITLSPTDFLRAVTGAVTLPLLFVRGGVKVRGDLAFAAGLIGYFDLPTP
ncbi:SCP2 sterol-binding domain-containing protein [Actinophytocola xanthii]|uniref:Alkyl sulfatase C-terminal domain-containing protein n=1 Tax=Actinophytocola xanthii TaxID=1912961 RepID=A0A1Q8CV51_9PSEU|nr:alkyl sulfatase C-terminal domain-containing protein [Actinophytocola xanthii]OLF18241.1 hypothetical protein BU204_06655 [Actinophytocola xanthii]